VNDFTLLKKVVKDFLEEDSGGHDYYHAERVFNNALRIQKHEGGNIQSLGAAALVHDIMRPWEKKTGKSHFGKKALKKIEEVLKVSKVSEKVIKDVLQLVKYHDIYDCTGPTRIDGKLSQTLF